MAKIDQAQVELCERAGVPILCLVCPQEMAGPFSERVALAQKSYRRTATGVDWLRELDLKLWGVKESLDWRGKPACRLEKRSQLTPSEWDLMLRVIQEVKAPLSMVNVDYGFNIGMTVYEPERPALYPGVEETLRSSLVLVVSSSQLPHESGRVSFDEAWDMLSPLVLAQENLELLRRCGLPQPPTKGQLTY